MATVDQRFGRRLRWLKPVVDASLRVTANLGEKAAYQLDPYHRPLTLRYDYPPSSSERPRYGWGAPVHPGIDAALAAHRDRYAQELDRIAVYEKELSAIPVNRPRGELCWHNPWLQGLDIASIYSVIRDHQPARYHEVGSGTSTRVAAMARADGDFAMHISSVDPQPRSEIDALCDQVHRVPYEDAALDFAAQVQAGDVVFVDCSHRLFTGSDATVFWLETLHQLPVGTIVGVHDILLPADYPPGWQEFWFNEQMIVGAYLLAGTPRVTPFLSCGYVNTQQDLLTRLDPMWDRFGVVPDDRTGFLLWFTIEDAVLS